MPCLVPRRSCGVIGWRVVPVLSRLFELGLLGHFAKAIGHIQMKVSDRLGTSLVGQLSLVLLAAPIIIRFVNLRGHSPPRAHPMEMYLWQNYYLK